jgi:putative membrane protein
MKTYQIALQCLAICGLYSCQSPEQHAIGDTGQLNNKDVVAAQATQLNALESTFLKEATTSGLIEEEMAAKMIKTTENPDVQNLATIMLKEHKQANIELMNIAKKLRIQVDRKIPEDKQKLIEKLAQMDEYEKNRLYANLMVTDHKKAIEIFNKGTQVANKDLSAFAN